jgi:pilus assembly protein CpaF
MNHVPVPDETLVARFRAAVGQRLAQRTAAAQRAGDPPLDRDDQMALARRFLNDELERFAGECLAAGDPLLSEDQEEAVASAVFNRLFELGRLQPLLDDERITDIICNGHDQVFLVYADGRKVPGPPVASSTDEFIEILREIGRRSGLSEREFNPSRPSLNVQLPTAAASSPWHGSATGPASPSAATAT